MGANLKNRLTAATSTEVAIVPEDNIESTIMALESRFQQAMPRGMEAAQLVRDAMNVIRANPKLATCVPASVMGALMTCAQLGLRPGIGALGQAHLIPFWDKNVVVSVDENGRERKGGMVAQFVIGYPGMIELANRSGLVDLIVARDVHQNDEFHIDYGTDELHHKPAMGGRGPVIGYYAKFYRMGGNRATFEFMSVADAIEHRDKFATQKNKQGVVWGPWVDHPDAMAKKTCIRRIFKWMPKSTDVQNAIIADETVRVDYIESADLAITAKRVDVENTERSDREATAREAAQRDETARAQTPPETTGEVPPGMTADEYAEMLDREARGE